jgi:PRC-barrel domain
MIKAGPGSLVAALVMISGTSAEDGKGQVVDLPVFAADSIKIGRVLDVSITDGRIDQISVSTSATLGFGERIVTVPQPTFMIMSGRPSSRRRARTR